MLNNDPTSMAKKTRVLWQGDFHSHQCGYNHIVDQIYQMIILANLPLSISKQELKLVIDEAVNNAMSHGNRWQKEKIVRIQLRQIHDKAVLSIRDQGCGFDFQGMQGMPARQKKNAAQKRLTGRGHGIQIIRSLCRVSWNDRGNEILLQL